MVELVNLVGLAAPGERPFALSNEGGVEFLLVIIIVDGRPCRSVITLVIFMRPERIRGLLSPYDKIGT